MTTPIRERIASAIRFARDGVWDVYPNSVTKRVTRFRNRCLRIAVLVYRGFHRDECVLHASALTFNTLMAIVPVLAISLALARGLGDPHTAKQKIKDAVYDWTQTFVSEVEHIGNASADAAGAGTGAISPDTLPHATAAGESRIPDVTGLTEPPPSIPAQANVDEFSLETLRSRINSGVDDIFRRVDRISFAALGGVGLIGLMWFVVSALGRIESSFNRVWGVDRGRSTWRKCTDYLSILLIVPVLATVASSLPILSTVRAFAGAHGDSPWLDGFLRALVTWGMTTLTFSFILLFVPNTRVKLVPGLIGGFVTAMLFIAWLRLCAALQMGVTRAGQVYGSFAVIPILLAWVNVSWRIVLFGAEVAYAVQNSEDVRLDRGVNRAGLAARWAIALDMLLEAAARMAEGRGGIDVQDYGRARAMPARLVNEVVSRLRAGAWLGELAEQPGCFVLMRAPSDMPIDAILRCFTLGATVTREEEWTPLTRAVANETASRAIEAPAREFDGVTIQTLLRRQADTESNS